MTRNWVWAVAATAALGLGLGLGACGDDDDDGAAAPPPTAGPGPTTCTPPATATAPFHTAVHPILEARCTPCHATTYGSPDRTTAFNAARAQVNTTTPEQSALIQKGDGRTAHGGGDRFDPGVATTTEVTTVLTWIRECAQNNE